MRYRLDGKLVSFSDVVMALADVGLPPEMAIHFAWIPDGVIGGKGPNAGQPRERDEKTRRTRVAKSKGQAESPVAESAPMSYREFIASGKGDKEWDAYAEQQNNRSREKAASKLLASWHAGGENSGREIANFLLSRGIRLDPANWEALQHDDTVVSKTSVSGRGMKRGKAKKIHAAVSAAMNSLP